MLDPRKSITPVWSTASCKVISHRLKIIKLSLTTKQRAVYITNINESIPLLFLIVKEICRTGQDAQWMIPLCTGSLLVTTAKKCYSDDLKKIYRF